MSSCRFNSGQYPLQKLRPVKQSRREADPKPPMRLINRAKAVATHAYAPYSRFRVGAALELTDGRIFTGANMENASYGLTVCAEIGALQAASSRGALGKVKRIAIVGGPMDKKVGQSPRPTPPCGRCRQLISEAAQISGRDIEVWFADLTGKHVQRRMISELLPDSFDAKNLK
jgi:cytidine deaminase